MIFRKLYYLLSPGLRRLARRIFFMPADLTNRIIYGRDKLVPPRGMIFTGGGDYVALGDMMLSSIVQLCNVSTNARVLDIGCGIGRLSRPLSSYLSRKGSYEGFDIVKEGIDWCKKAYVDFPNFRFTHIPLQNDLYNLSSREKAAGITFPYETAGFDLVILTSVFTHMQKEDVQQYLREIGRVLKKGGSCFCTFFVITAESDSFLVKSKNPFFPYRYDDFYLHDNRVKNANIAYKSEVLEEMINKSGLVIKSFHPGWWAGLKKENCVNFQDVMILTTSDSI